MKKAKSFLYLFLVSSLGFSQTFDISVFKNGKTDAKSFPQEQKDFVTPNGTAYFHFYVHAELGDQYQIEIENKNGNNFLVPVAVDGRCVNTSNKVGVRVQIKVNSLSES